VNGIYSGGLSTIKLHAIGTQTAGGYASAMHFVLDNDGVERNHAIFSSDGSTTLYGALTFSNSLLVRKNGSDTIALGPYFQISDAAANNAIIFQLNASNDLDFWTYNTTDSWVKKITFTQSGNVGIGTSTPQLNTNTGTFLTVQGTNANGWLELATTSTTDGLGGAITFNNTNVVGSDKRVAQITVGRAGANNSADMSFSTWNAGSSGTRLTITAAGAATFSGTLTMSAYSYASSALQFTRAPSNLVQPASGNGILVFAGGTAQMRMDTANQICFDMNNGGTPHTVLTLKQSANTISINSPDNTLPLEIKYQNVAYGYYGATSGFSGAALAYSVNGGYVYLSSSSTWIGASDRNIKKNFEPYNKGLEAICGLEPTLYNLKIQQDSEPKLVGLIAQEVNNYIPEAYSEEGDFIGLNYNAIIVTMINAIKELKAEIDILKNN
jgi:hypothetical protein